MKVIRALEPEVVRALQLQALRNRMDRALEESARSEGTDGEEFMQSMLDGLDPANSGN